MAHESPRAEMKSQTPKPQAEANSEKSQAELRAGLERRLHALKPVLDIALAEYAKALTDDTFEDKDGEEPGTGEKRQTDMQNKIRNFVERAEGMRRQLDSGEEISQMPDEEELVQATAPFMLDTFKNSWGWDTTNFKPEGHAIAPQAQNYEALSKDVDATKRGEYTLNPETQGIYFEKAKAFVPDLSALNGKPIHEVIQHVVDTYGDRYHIPGIEYWKWLIENPGKNPLGVNIKDGNYYFMSGSVLRGKDGRWLVPSAYWLGSEWHRSAPWLSNDWYSLYRVVLLEK